MQQARRRQHPPGRRASTWLLEGAELAAQPPFRGVQLWIAQPEEARHGDAAFPHHAELPGVEVTGGEGMVLAGR